MIYSTFLKKLSPFYVINNVLPLSIKVMVFCFGIFGAGKAGAQNLGFSGTGQTGTSGTNWTSSGTNPVTITGNGAANINVSVITGYLNAGISVVVNNNSVGTGIYASISKTAGGNASLTFKDIGNIKVGSNVSIGSSSNVLNMIFWADSDNSQDGTVDDFMFVDAGASFSSNGGKIVMAGGADNGANGGVSGDGIPDGFAWNGSNSGTYSANLYGGLTLGPRTGPGTVISIMSNGGDIIMRGATSNNNNYPGITSQGNLKIVSGTGKITMYGKSSTGHGTELTYGATPSIAISSNSSSTPAIDLKGTTSATGYSGFWASNAATGDILIQSLAATGGGVSIEGTCINELGIWLGTNGTSITSQVLSQAGTILLKGFGGANKSLMLSGDVYVGNQGNATAVHGVAPAVTASSANILFQANDQVQFSTTAGKIAQLNSTGSLTFEAYQNSYGGTLSWSGNYSIGSAFSSITMGNPASNYAFLLNRSLTAAGNITAYTSDFTLADGVGMASSVAGTVRINCNGSFNTTGAGRRTISTVGGNINIYADADASGNGLLDIDYLTLNPGTGNTTLRCETMGWATGNSTDKPYLNGTGSVTIEPADGSFQDVNNSWFVFDQDANGMTGLVIGKPTNTGNITIGSAINVAGSIALYGGLVNISANLTSSATGDIFIKSNTALNGGASLANNAAVLKTAGTGTLTMQSRDRLNSGTITASGSGVLNVVLWSDYANSNTGGVAVTGVTTNGGHFWLGGSNSPGGTYTWKGLAVGNGPSVGAANNNYNAIDFSGPINTSGGDVLVWGGDGYGGGINGIGAYAGASINAGSGNITLIADDILQNTLSLTTTGKLSLLPNAGSYPAAITWSGTITGGNFSGTNKFGIVRINNFAALGGLSIGYFDEMIASGTPVVMNNSSNITVGSATSIAGAVSLYGNAIIINQNVSSTTGGDIHFTGNNLSIAGGVSISSTGKLVIEPIAAATTIGLSGGAGTLAVTAANFNSNFADGFSEINIGNNTAGNITLGSAITTKDHLRLTTTGNLVLNEVMQIDNNNFRFAGNNIIPATGKFIKTNGVGKLLMNINNAGDKLYPLGTTYYSPVTITNHTGIADEFYATVSDGVYQDGSTSGTALTWTPRVDLTWNIGNASASTGAGNVDLAFGWNAGDVAGSFTAPKLQHHNGTQWLIVGGSTSFDLTGNTLSHTSYSGSFSPFMIAEANSLLPVSWLSFTGRQVHGAVELKWATASEYNNAYFEIQRGIGSASFTTIGRINAALRPGARNEYLFTDYQVEKGRAYYRLKQVGTDGQSSYSNTISFTNAAVQEYSVSSVPGSKQLLVNIPHSQSGIVGLVIYDGTGRILQQEQVQGGRSTISLLPSINSGAYFVKLVKENRLLYSGRFVQ